MLTSKIIALGSGTATILMEPKEGFPSGINDSAARLWSTRPAQETYRDRESETTISQWAMPPEHDSETRRPLPITIRCEWP
jgi:hypothetical protein